MWPTGVNLTNNTLNVLSYAYPAKSECSDVLLQLPSDSCVHMCCLPASTTSELDAMISQVPHMSCSEPVLKASRTTNVRMRVEQNKSLSHWAHAET